MTSRRACFDGGLTSQGAQLTAADGAARPGG